MPKQTARKSQQLPHAGLKITPKPTFLSRIKHLENTVWRQTRRIEKVERQMAELRTVLGVVEGSDGEESGSDVAASSSAGEETR